MSKPRVLISVPNMGWTHKGNTHALDLLQRDPRVAYRLVRPTAVPYENNMHGIVKEVLAGEYDFWLNLDADNAPTRNPLDLISLDLDLVGCPYPSARFEKAGEFPFFWSAFDYDGERGGFRQHPYRPGVDPPLQEVDAVSSGCILVARRVLLAVKQPLMRRYDADGIVEMGGDFSFCTKAKAAGFRVWAHYDYPARHFVKDIDLLELMRVLGAEEKATRQPGNQARRQRGGKRKRREEKRATRQRGTKATRRGPVR